MWCRDGVLGCGAGMERIKECDVWMKRTREDFSWVSLKYKMEERKVTEEPIGVNRENHDVTWDLSMLTIISTHTGTRMKQYLFNELCAIL